jgi:DNA polymerase-3 subunit beta
LLKQISIADGVISSKSPLPILEGLLFTLKQNSLTITASDLETTLVTSLEVMSDADGSVVIPSKILLDTLKALPQQPITIHIDEDTQAVEITSAYGKYKLSGINAAEYPEPPVPQGDSDTVAIPAAVLGRAISRTLFATSNDELRPAMTGVYFNIDFQKATFVATDAHKLVRYTAPIEGEVSTTFIVPKKALNLLKNALPGTGDVQVSFNKSNAFFSFSNLSLACRLIDARYPDYNAVIPVDNPNLLTANRGDLLSSLKRIAIYANKSSNQVVLNIGDKSLTVSAQDLDFSNEAIEQMTCNYEGEPLMIGFNAKFLIEMLNVLESDEVKIELSAPNRAGILRPVEESEGEDILMLVMPVMLSN